MSLTDMDEALIEKALEGSPRAWERLVKRYEGQVYNFGLRLTGNQSDALDLMQEVFIGVYRNLHRFRGEARFSSWLFRIAHNKSVDMHRRRRPAVVQEGSARQDDEDSGFVYENQPDRESLNPEQSTLLSERNAEIARLLGRLRKEQRLLIDLKLYQSLTFEEIAEMQKISANTAKTRFYSALRRLRSLMEEEHAM